MDIAINFDGTCVTHEFPKIGLDIGAGPVLRELIKCGHRLILSTMRSDIHHVEVIDGVGGICDKPGYYLTAAVEWFKKNEIELYGVNKNPTQESWTHSPKAYAHIYIGDDALGCPLKGDYNVCSRPFVDWEKVRTMLMEKGVIWK